MLLALNPVFERKNSNDGTNANSIISHYYKDCKWFFAVFTYFLFFDDYSPKESLSERSNHSKMLKSSCKSFVLTMEIPSSFASNCVRRALRRSSALRLTVLPAARIVFTLTYLP